MRAIQPHTITRCEMIRGAGPMKIVELGHAKVLFSFGCPVVYFDGYVYHVTATPSNGLTEKHVGDFLASEEIDRSYTGRNIRYVSSQFLENIA
jgi:hypothetical protein